MDRYENSRISLVDRGVFEETWQKIIRVARAGSQFQSWTRVTALVRDWNGSLHTLTTHTLPIHTTVSIYFIFAGSLERVVNILYHVINVHNIFCLTTGRLLPYGRRRLNRLKVFFYRIRWIVDVEGRLTT